MTETVPTTSSPAEQTNPPVEAPAGAATGAGDVLDKAKAVAGDAAKAVEEKGKDVWDSIKGIWNDTTKEGGLGKILGGLLGIAGAWFIGNFFEGIIGTILTVVLAFPLMAIGSDKLGGLFNSWMGHGKEGNEQARGPDVSKSRSAGAQGQETEQNVAGTGKPLAITELTETELNAMLERNPTDTLTLTKKANNRIVIEPGNADLGGQVDVQALRDIMNSGRVGPGEQAAIDFVVYDGVAKVGADFAAVPLSQNSQVRAR